MILCVAPVAYRRAAGALESPKGQLLCRSNCRSLSRSGRYEIDDTERPEAGNP